MSLLINAYCTVREVPELTFPHRLLGQRRAPNPDLAEHLNGFIGYVLKHKQQQMTQCIYYTIKHIQRVRNHLSLEIEDSSLDAFAQWAWDANAICFLPDGTICNPSGQIILPQAPEPENQILPPHPKTAQARKARVEAGLGLIGIRTPASLPPVTDESELELRPADECAKRALGLFICALRAESLASQTPISVPDILSKFDRGLEFLTKQEKAFLEAQSPSEQAIITSTWRYECIYVLLWCLGHLKELPPPTEICDVPWVARTLFTTEAFLSDPRYRSATEILDALDHHYRLQWLSHQVRHDGTTLPGGLQSGVINERLYALNWITRFYDADWDEIDTPA